MMEKQTLVDPETLDFCCYPLAAAVVRYQEENVPFIRVHRLIDAFEVLVKYTASFTLFYCKSHLQDEARESFYHIFQESICRPSLGHWVGYLRDLFRQTQVEPAWSFLEMQPFAALTKSFRKIQPFLDAFLALRNRYGHGAVAKEATCLKDCVDFEPRLAELLEFFRPLLTLPLYTSDGEECCLWQGTEGRACALPVGSEGLLSPFTVCNDEVFSLFPLMYIPDQPAHLFYNSLRDRKKQRFDFLDYETGVHFEESRRVAPHFLIHFTKEDNALVNGTAARRLAYLENFVGRRRELRTLLEFLEKAPKGHFMIWGAPGVGKGALISQVEEAVVASQDYSFLSDACQRQLKKLQEGVVVTYILDQKDADPVFLLRTLVAHLTQKLHLKKTISNDRIHLIEALRDLLNEASQRKLAVLMIIDGLDEALRMDGSGNGITSVIPSYLPDGCFVMLTSRVIQSVQRFWNGLDREHRNEMTLQGISAEEVQEMLCSEVSKYEVFDHPEFVQRLYESSLGADAMQGNPLFVKLVLNDLRQGRLALNKLSAIPDGLIEMYREFLQKLSDGGRDLLYLATAALGPLSLLQMAKTLDRDKDRVACDLVVVQEMLEEHSENDVMESYSLFHKSLGDYLAGHDRGKLEFFSFKLLNFCRNWRGHIADWKRAMGKGYPEAPALRHSAVYALRHLCDHLLDAIEWSGDAVRESLLQELVVIIDDADFREKIFEYCGNLCPLQRGIVGAQKLLAAQDGTGRYLAVMVRFALYMTDEKQRLLRQATVRLEDAAKEGDWFEVLSLVEMRETGREKVFAALQALCLLPINSLTNALGPINERVRSLLRFEADPQLDACYQEVVDMLARKVRSRGNENRFVKRAFRNLVFESAVV
jgi:hypothetical protein